MYSQRSRTIDELLESASDVIHRGTVAAGNWNLEPLFSGGHDSLCATFLASQHPRFSGTVHHIDTGIGALYTRRYVEDVCSRFGWNLRVHKSPETYERYVSRIGFPGPGRHAFVYNRLKERCVRMVCEGRARRVLITGCRSQESVRRMGFVEPVKIGERRKNGEIRERKRIWTAPCHDWSTAEQMLFMDEFGLPTNRLKIALGLSGECFCGCFAAEGEREAINEHAPDVGEEIDRLTVIARDRKVPCRWGHRPDGKVVVARTGEMCSSCDLRAVRFGIQIECS